MANTIDIKGMGTICEGTPHKCYHSKISTVCNVIQHAVGLLNKDKTDARVKHFKSQDSFLKYIKEND